mmetsp:Transcript_17781/g.40245  ORF Transcript_17781/g.40245 Transcript_17781/m.40245 type:complete len:207 (+) Transcript_17781:4625-5245(+)
MISSSLPQCTRDEGFPWRKRQTLRQQAALGICWWRLRPFPSIASIPLRQDRRTRRRQRTVLPCCIPPLQQSYLSSPPYCPSNERLATRSAQTVGQSTLRWLDPDSGSPPDNASSPPSGSCPQTQSTSLRTKPWSGAIAQGERSPSAGLSRCSCPGRGSPRHSDSSLPACHCCLRRGELSASSTPLLRERGEQGGFLRPSLQSTACR